MKVINVYRDKVGELCLGYKGQYHLFFAKNVEDLHHHMRNLFEGRGSYIDSSVLDHMFPNGLEAAFVTSITEEELNNV